MRTRKCWIIEFDGILFLGEFTDQNELVQTHFLDLINFNELSEFYNEEVRYPNTSLFRKLYKNGFEVGSFWVIRDLILDKKESL